MSTAVQRRLPIGAEPTGIGVHFRVWAPCRKRVDVVFEGARGFPLQREFNGYFSGVVELARAGMQYRFRLDGGDAFFPDPASRFQPKGPHGPSQVECSLSYDWKDAGWPGVCVEIGRAHV